MSIINGTGPTDSLTGTSGSDTINAGTGVDTVDGAAGIDTLTLQSSRSSYTITQINPNTVHIVNAVTGEDITASNVEFFKFTDSTLSAYQLIPPPNIAPVFGYSPGGTFATPPGSNDQAWSAVPAPDGHVYMVGEDGSGRVEVWRLNADGTLDTAYNPDFAHSLNYFTQPNGGFLRAEVQADGKLVIGGLDQNNDFSVVRLNADGSMDTSFGGGDGMASTLVGGFDQQRSMSIQADGKIILAGSSQGPYQRELTMVRFNADGTLDTSFGSGGSVVAAFPSSRATTVQATADGHIMLSGTQVNPANTSQVSMILQRYDSSGALDGTFGSGGTVVTAIADGSISTATRGMAIQADGKIDVLGMENSGAGDGSSHQFVIRYNPNGSIDTSFGSDGTGKVYVPVSSYQDLGRYLMVESDGKIVIAGTSTDANGQVIAPYLARLNTDGSIDTTFGINGVAIGPLNGGIGGEFLSVREDANGNLLVGSAAVVGDDDSDTSAITLRYTHSGQLDTSFNMQNALAGKTLAGAGGPAVTMLWGQGSFFDAELASRGDYNGSTLTIRRTGGAVSTDIFGFDSSIVQVSGNNVMHDGVTFATYTKGGGTLTIHFNSNANQGVAYGINNVITWQNSSVAAGTHLSFDWSFDDGSGAGNAVVTGQTSIDVATLIQGDANANALTNTVAGVDAAMYGGAGNDSLTGNTGDDMILGEAGNDVLVGGAGNDSMRGGTGSDTMNGGAGNDTIDGGDITDRVNYTDRNVLTLTGATTGALIDLSHMSYGDGVDKDGLVFDGQGGIDRVANVDFIVATPFNDVIHGSGNPVFEQFEGGQGDDFIDGGGMRDTLNNSDSNRATFVNATSAENINLGTGTASGGDGNDTLVNINHVRGSAFNDTITGSNRTDFTEQFEGMAGNDTIDGKGGFDIVRYDGGSSPGFSMTSGVNVNLATGTANDGQGGTDTLINIEGVRGSALNDTLTGGNPANGTVLSDGLSEVFVGMGGNDTIDGGQGYDRADYNTETSGSNVTLGGTGTGTAQDGLGGTDTLINIEAVRGGAFNDTLTGSDSGAFESFEGREGNDVIDGKGGTDRADYNTSPNGVNVNLQTGVAQDGWGGTDSLANIENVRGSRDSNDTIVGNGAFNLLQGQGGDDNLAGGDGNDTLQGGNGNDTLDGGNNDDWVDGGTGADVMQGGAGNDWADYSSAVGAINANLGTGLVADGSFDDIGNPNVDTISGFENIKGSNFADSIVGSEAGNEQFTGGAGNDTIDGGGGFGDGVAYWDSNTAVNVNLANHLATRGGETDTINNIQNVYASTGNDTITGDAGDNNLNGGLGNDLIDGGANGQGGDWTGYYDATAGQNINLATGSSTGGGGNDTLVGIENTGGSGFGDTITGTTGNNALRGEGGNDKIDGGAGDDYITGGAGNDSITGGTGFDTADYFYSNATAGITANLATGIVQDGEGGTDTLSGVEGIHATNFNDSITGNGNDNFIDSGAGVDTVDGGGGNDTLRLAGNQAGYSITVTGHQVHFVNAGTGVDVVANNMEFFQFDDAQRSLQDLGGDAPPVQNSSFVVNTAEDTPFTFSAAQFLANFSDADGDPLTVSFAGLPEITDNGNGTFTYTPPRNFNGTTFSGGIFTVSDGHGGTATGQIQYNVSPVNDAPAFVGGFNGFATLGHDGTGANATDLAVQSDGKIVAPVEGGGNAFLGVMRLNADGTPDASYGTNGVATFSLANYTIGNQVDAKVAVDSVGRTILSASYTGASDTGIIAVRFNADGTLDSTFNGGTGFNKIALSTTQANMRSMTLDSSGHILMTGWDFDFPASNRDTNVVRLNADGTRDATWGTNGVVTLSLSAGDERPDSVIALADGSVLVAGRARDASNVAQAVVVKLTATGAIDTSYHGTGEVQLMPPGFSAAAVHGMAVQADGSVIVVGFGTKISGSLGDDGFITRLHADGSLDTSFNGTGWLFPTPPNGATQTGVWRVMLDGSHIVVTGDAVNNNNTDVTQSFVLRLNSDGTPDTTFGNGGYTVIQASNGLTPVLLAGGDVAVPVIVGDFNAGTLAAGVVRLNSDGTVDSAFDPAPGNPAIVPTGQNITVSAADLLRGWTDADGNPIHLGLVTVDHGSIQSQGSGETAVYTVTPTSGYGGPLTLTYNVLDSVGASAQGSRTYTVTPSDVNLVGTGGNDSLVGGAGNDTLTGLAGNDTLIGNDGNDQLTGGAGNDSISGGNGWDSANYSDAATTAAVVVNLATGLVTGGAGSDTLSGIEQVFGSNFNDSITGNAQDNFLFGNGGNDTINAGDGNDLVQGGAGNDSLNGGGNGFFDTVDYADATAGVAVNLVTNRATGGAGSDTLAGFENVNASNFNDTLTGDDNNNNFQGLAGSDTIVGAGGWDDVGYSSATTGVNVNLATGSAKDGQGGTDVLSGIEQVDGSRFNDTLVGDGNANSFVGNEGDDFMDGGAGGGNMVGYWTASGSVFVNLANGIATGAAGNDTFVNIQNIGGSAFDDTLIGDGSGNFIDGGAGNDFIDGGAGVDTVTYQGATGGMNVNLGLLSVTGAENDTLTGIENVNGSRFDDTLTGDGGDNTFLGGAGNDVINGGGGTNDWSNYGDAQGVGVNANLATGAVTGGSGNDTLSGIENVDGSGFNDTLTGDAGANALRGEAGNDSISGNDGNDYITGGAGNDTINGGNGVDTADYFFSNASAGINANLSAATATVTGGDGNDTLVGIENINATNFNDTLTGDANANFLQGEGGNDSINAGAGNDNIAGGDGNDTILGGAGGDFIRGGAGNDSIDGGVVLDRANYVDGNSLSYSDSTGAIVMNLTGITGDGSVGTGTVQDGLGGTDTVANVQFITGSNFNDSIVGSGARIFEQFDGGAGNDTINGGALTDLVAQFDANRVLYQSATAAVNVNLTTGTATGGGGNDTLINITQVRGSNFGDTITGSDRTDYTEQYDGRAGNDTIDGKGGFDVARYDQAATTGVNVNLVTGVATDGQGGTDTLLNIEGVFGSSFNDTLTGGNAANGTVVGDGLSEIFRGGAGNDTIDGGQGYDRADYTSSSAGAVVTLGGTGNGTASDGLGGTDTLINIEAVRGSDFNDTLTGSDSGAFESFEGRAGNDVIDGKGGTDRADYQSSTAAVNVNLTTGVASADGWGSSDTLANIEWVRGSTFNDTIVGGAVANNLQGGAGNDSIAGADGDDTMDGGTGADTVDGGNGNDTVVLHAAFASYTISRPNGTDTVFTNAATGENVTARGVEFFQFTDGTMTLSQVQGNSLSIFDDNYVGTDGDDSIDGLAGNDTLSGLGGNDTINGNVGNDSMIGGTGDDLYIVDNAADVVVENADEGIDSVNVAYTAAGTFTMAANVENATVTSAGTLAVNVVGNALANMITGNGGNNSLTGGDGNDTLDGGAGTDTLVGGAGDDTYVIGASTDVINETAVGSGGWDTVRVGFTTGSYTLGTNIDAAVVTGTAAVGLVGNGLDNYLEGNVAGNNIAGGDGNDTIVAMGGNDTIAGGNGDDTIDAGTAAATGNDSVDGGTGTNTLMLQGDFGTYTVSRTATDTILSNAATGERVAFHNITWVSFNGDVHSMADVLNNSLSPFNDIYIGDDTAESINGQAGNDSLVGNGGNDTIDGGTGNDTLVGGTGDDTYFVDNAADVVVENTNEGFDVVNVAYTAAGTFTMSANVENATVTSAGTLAVHVIGNASDNFITGNGGNQSLTGGAGDDTLDGGAGNDTLIGGSGDDTYVVNIATDVINETAVGSDGNDTVMVSFTAGGTYVMSANVENAVVTNALAVNVTGNAGANTITGGAGNNALLGGDGDDTLVSSTGTDTLDGGNGNDVVVVMGARAAYTVTRTTATDTTLVNNVTHENIVLRNVESVQFTDGVKTMSDLWGNNPSAFPDSLVGTGGNDSIDGGAGNDTILGLGGDDTLIGNTGNDSLVGGTGNDVYSVDSLTDVVVENAGEGTDQLNVNFLAAGVFNMATNAANVENATVVTSNATLSVGITGNSLDNLLTGNAAANALTGGDGNDTLNGGAGKDTLAGGAGNDVYYIDLSTDIVNESATGSSGVDTVNIAFAAAASYVMTTGVENAFIINGTSGVNVTGNASANFISGNVGNNTLAGAGGSDTIYAGGGGNDSVDGGTETDTLILDGTIADYTVTRPTATTTLFSKAGTSITVANVEFVQFDDGTVAIGDITSQVGSPNPDVLTGHEGDDFFDGGAGNDTISGGAGDDTLNGGIGNDSITGGTGGDMLDGGDGSDIYVFNAGDGDDLIVQNDTISADIDVLRLTQAGINSDNVTFSRGYQTYNDLVVTVQTGSDDTGTVEQVVIVNFFTNDSVNIGTIDQVVIAATGQTFTQAQIKALILANDGDGDHVFVGYDSADVINGGGNSDWISAGANNDTVTGGAGNDTMFGGSGNDTMSGGDDNDLIIGGAGNDTLAGGAGDDSLSGGAGSDTYQFGMGDGHDVISEAIFPLTDGDTDSGIGPMYVVTDGDSPLSGETDVLAFAAGVAESDVRATRVDNDLVLTIQSSGDSVTVDDYFANGVSTIERVTFASGSSWTSTQIRAKVLVPTSGDDSLTGYIGGEKLNGLGGDDTVNGGGGNDTINGGAGHDVLTGGTGADKFVFDTSWDGTDTITDFQSGVDTIMLSKAEFGGLVGSVGARIGLSDHLTYDNASGELVYDADGAGGNDGVVVAIIGTDVHPLTLGQDFVLTN